MIKKGGVEFATFASQLDASLTNNNHGVCPKIPRSDFFV
jgi:hypothetical protein